MNCSKHPPASAQAFPAPAKLNLDLRIVGRRADGYHLLESIFCYIGLSDTVYLAGRSDGLIMLHTPTDGLPQQQDLAYRAAQCLQAYAGATAGVDIWLDKQIPTGGGLGGGSSDAATVLLALNRIWSCGLDTQELIRLGVGLGADVPFFLFGRNAFARGIGEELSVMDVPAQWYVVVKPQVHVSTAVVFNHAELTRNSPSCPAPSYAALQPFRNDMQAVVLQEYPQVAEVHRILGRYGDARMTGSGACVFVAAADREAAQKIAAHLPENWQTWCAEGLPHHPLYNKI